MDDQAIRDLLDILLEMVEQKRHDHSQAAEVCKRRYADAQSQAQQIAYANREDLHLRAEMEFRALHAEMRAVIESEFVKESS